MAGAGKIVDIFKGFARSCVPDEAFLILEFYQEEWGQEGNDPSQPAVYYSPYLETETILAALEPYWTRLIHDGFVGFGLANNRRGMELFYSEEKCLTCFTGNHLRIMDLFSRFELFHRKKLLLPSDFGHDHLSLQGHKRYQLPSDLAVFAPRDLDYTQFCGRLTEEFDMYPVEESISFFLTQKEQDQIEAIILQHPELSCLAEEDFGTLILDWNDFVEECEQRFEGDLWEYQQGLKLRDLLLFVTETAPPALRKKLGDILAEPDRRFQQSLVDHRKRLDPPNTPPLHGERFWYQGVVRNQGTPLRRDLIRHGWYHP